MLQRNTFGLILAIILGYTALCFANNCPSPYQMFYGETGERCCKPITCPPGHEGIICDEMDPESSRCDPCEIGSYQLTTTNLGIRCRIMTPCLEPNMIVLMRGNATQDRVCGCEEGYVLSGNHMHCTIGRANNSTGDEENESKNDISVILGILIPLLVLGILVSVGVTYWKFFKPERNPVHAEKNLDPQTLEQLMPMTDPGIQAHDRPTNADPDPNPPPILVHNPEEEPGNADPEPQPTPLPNQDEESANMYQPQFPLYPDEELGNKSNYAGPQSQYLDQSNPDPANADPDPHTLLKSIQPAQNVNSMNNSTMIGLRK